MNIRNERILITGLLKYTQSWSDGQLCIYKSRQGQIKKMIQSIKNVSGVVTNQTEVVTSHSMGSGFGEHQKHRRLSK